MTQDIPKLKLRDVVMFDGTYRSVLMRVKIEHVQSSVAVHCCFRPADARDAAMTGPTIHVGSVIGFQAVNGSDFVVMKLTSDETAREYLLDKRQTSKMKLMSVIKLCIEAVDPLEAQRRIDEIREHQELRRAGLKQIKDQEHG